jgi:hypothetical protein
MKKIITDRFYRIIAIALFTIALTACITGTPEVLKEKTIEQGEQDVPTAPTQDPAYGSLIGVLQLKGEAVESVTLGLANVIIDAEGQEIATSFNRNEAPITVTSSDGRFLFENINPGRYGLIYASLPESYLLLIPNNSAIQEAVLMTIEAGKETNLGILNYSELPGE